MTLLSDFMSLRVAAAYRKSFFFFFFFLQKKQKTKEELSNNQALQRILQKEKKNLKARMRVYLDEWYRGHTDPEHCGSREQCSLPSTLSRDTDTGSGGTHNMVDTWRST